MQQHEKLNAPLLTLSVILLVITLAGSTSAEEVYVWTDEDGKKHFGQHPPSTSTSTTEVSEETFELTNLDEGYPHTDPELYRDNASSYLERKRAEREAKAELQSKRRSQLVTACAEARERLEQMAGPVIFVDDTGNPVSVTERERQQEQKELAEKIKQHCD